MFPVCDPLRNATDRRRDTGKPACHRFKEGDRRPVRNRRRDEDVSVPVVRRDFCVRGLLFERYGTGQVLRPDELPDLFFFRAIAFQDKGDLLVLFSGECEPVDKGLVVVYRKEPPVGEDPGGPGTGILPCRSLPSSSSQWLIGWRVFRA